MENFFPAKMIQWILKYSVKYILFLEKIENKVLFLVNFLDRGCLFIRHYYKIIYVYYIDFQITKCLVCFLYILL